MRTLPKRSSGRKLIASSRDDRYEQTGHKLVVRTCDVGTSEKRKGEEPQLVIEMLRCSRDCCAVYAQAKVKLIAMGQDRDRQATCALRL